jgi:hypothetical protein
MVNLSGFCEIQKEIWERYTSRITECECKSCNNKTLKMTSKWRCICETCNTSHTIKKPKNFPKNMNDKRNWKATCEECGGTMDYNESGFRLFYLCRKCGNVLEV